MVTSVKPPRALAGKWQSDVKAIKVSKLLQVTHEIDYKIQLVTTIEQSEDPVAPAHSQASFRTRLQNFGRPPRVMGLDLARGLAILGMVVAHLDMPEEVDLFAPGTWGALANGRSSLLFALLAGISISFMTGGRSRPSAAELPQIRLAMLGRGAFIFAIGLVLELLNTPIAVILTIYGVLYVAAIPFLRWSAGKLLVLSVICAVLGPATLAVLKTVLLEPSAPGVMLTFFGIYSAAAWLALIFAGMAIGQFRLASAATAGKLLAAGMVLAFIGYGAALIPAPGSVTPFLEESFDGEELIGDSSMPMPEYAPAEKLDLGGMYCEGEPGSYVSCVPPEEVPERQSMDEPGLSSGQWPDSSSYDASYFSGMGWAELAQTISPEEIGASAWLAFFSAEPHSGATAEIIGSGGFALIVLGLCLLVAAPLRWIALPVAAMGSMPLTAYCAHLVSYFIAAGPGGMLMSDTALPLTVMALLIGSTLWAIFLGRGPLERLAGLSARAMAGAPNPVQTGNRTTE